MIDTAKLTDLAARYAAADRTDRQEAILREAEAAGFNPDALYRVLAERAMQPDRLRQYLLDLEIYRLALGTLTVAAAIELAIHEEELTA